MDPFDILEFEETEKAADDEQSIQRPRKRRTKTERTKKLFSKHTVIGALALAVIIFAFIWEAVIDDSAYMPKGRTAEVQAEIAGFDWITPRLLPPNDYSRPGTQVTQINNIVIHYVGNTGTTAEQNRNYFANLAYTNANTEPGEEKTYSSSNFIVGLDGEVLQCVPINEVAYCTPGRNNDTISIECCHPDDTGEFSTDTYNATVRLTAYLCRSFNLGADDLLRHYDVTEKVCPKYYVENPGAWEQFKADVAAAIDAEV